MSMLHCFVCDKNIDTDFDIHDGLACDRLSVRKETKLNNGGTQHE